MEMMDGIGLCQFLHVDAEALKGYDRKGVKREIDSIERSAYDKTD